MITISDVFQSFTESQREAIYELIGKGALDGDYDYELYHKTQLGMSETQKLVMDILIRLCLSKEAFETWEVR